MNILKRTLKLTKNFTQLRHCSGTLYEPDYLEGLKPKVPIYDALNIQMRGYDYPVLESYQKYLNNIIKNMDINVEDGWALPAQIFKITKFKPQTEIIDSEYTLNLYDRTLQITDVPTTQLPLLLRVIEATTPVGVSINIVQHDDHYEEDRYIPDTDLLALKQELDDIGGPSKKK
ncbi:hypothetical protein GWI33_006253 [Rhynchophorus ferrugineus]|uniref:Small ribosomal subunit protein uS10 domain-containing protein n=1 Tax=Rhynchophorus ferrugineus TaxID=354439 RepID=A0A834IUY2_RHYFE|nr:hypothetical protein GWI33_006253 [Rhynchophorus ferrugineus]